MIKRLLYTFLLLCFSFTLKAQYGITQNIGSPSTLVQVPANGGFKAGLILLSFTDTTAANLTNLDFYTGSMVWCTADTSIYVRNKTSTSGYWFKIGGAGGGSGGAYWALTGNAMAAIPSGFGIGTNSTDALPFKTDATTRMILPSNGLVRSSGAANKSLKLDTTTKLLYYGDDSNIYNTNGSLTGNRTLDGGSIYDLNLSNLENLNITVDDNNSSTLNQYMRTANTVPYAVTFNNSSTYESGIVLSQNSTTITDTLQQISIYSSSFIPNFLYSTFPGTTGMRVRPNELLLRLRGLSTDNLKIVNLNSTTSSSWYPLAYNPTDSTVKYNSNGYFSTPISSLTAATGTNIINNADYIQEWDWNTLTSQALNLSTSSTARVNNGNMVVISSSGVNSSGSVKTTNLSVTNANSGASSTNIAGYFNATNASNNYAIIVPASGGSVGIGTSTPAKILHTVGTVRHASLGTASTDTTTYKPMGIDSNGDVFPMSYWPGGGGGVTTLAAIGSSPNANAATISGSTLNLEPASASFGGVVTTGAQTFAGAKTFSSFPTISAATSGRVPYFTTAGLITDASTLTYDAADFLSSGSGTGNIGLASRNTNASGRATLKLGNDANALAGFIFINGTSKTDYGGAGSLGFLTLESGAAISFHTQNNDLARLYIGNTGNIGLGTESPTMQLQMTSGRFGMYQGTDVASAAGAISLSSDGNSFEITGTAAITLISNVNWQNGSEVTLWFTSTATLTDGTANSGTDIGMELAGNTNFTASAGASLTLQLIEIGGTQRWREKCRSVN